MVKIVVAELNPPKAKAAKPAVRTARVRAPDGHLTTVRSIQADSESFGQDFQHVFARNVERVRRENRKVAGARS
ncbi:hypothetical protein [Rubellimicrobium aerolatum]|uniref:Uncharacterized protein n=1 Tax=Rubellimicrobium aerolatum TaxID=490979 RepID=A0ABW0SEU9_9RHOB|nr:hypothetical protein [Rubellimicrobium aerolatum]MBP1806967.1 hypothetical protein [Rubellimicrobium aerolatum]